MFREHNPHPTETHAEEPLFCPSPGVQPCPFETCCTSCSHTCGFPAFTKELAIAHNVSVIQFIIHLPPHLLRMWLRCASTIDMRTNGRTWQEVDCFVRKETTAKLHISLSADRAEDLTAWPCQITWKERRGGKNVSQSNNYWRNCKDRHGVWMQPTNMERSRRQRGYWPYTAKRPLPHQKKEESLSFWNSAQPAGLFTVEPERLGIETASSLRSESLNRSLFFLQSQASRHQLQNLPQCVCACVCFCVCECAAAMLLPSELTVWSMTHWLQLPPSSPPHITDSPSLITLSPLSSILRKLLLASLLTYFHSSLPGQQGFASSLFPS